MSEPSDARDFAADADERDGDYDDRYGEVPGLDADRLHDAITDPAGSPAVSVEALLDDLDRVTAERDSYLDDSRRLAAEFANFKRQVEKRNLELVEHANASLVEKLLPTLDACDAAIAHGATDVEPVLTVLLTTLAKDGLVRLHPDGEPFDPTFHEAVIHEDGDDHPPTVAEVLRTGYAWNGRVVRPALVKVRG